MTPSILLIDNYDSFVYNLARYLEELGCHTQVARNDAVTIEQVHELSPDAVVLSPGPCTPQEAGICLELVRAIKSTIPILGVCLGHQAIAAALGGHVVRSERPVHGQATPIRHDSTGLFAGCPNPMQVGRYHSLRVDESTLPTEFVVTSRTPDGTLMSLQHRQLALFGIQFHPESILTECGHQLLINFLDQSNIRTDRMIQHQELIPDIIDADDFYQREMAEDAFRPG